MSKACFSWQSALTRALIGALGGFMLAISFMMGTAGSLTASGLLTRADAVVTAGMLAFLAWMIAVLVAFGAASVRRAAAWVLGSATGFALLGWGSIALMGNA
jgi:hypothetical protein